MHSYRQFRLLHNLYTHVLWASVPENDRNGSTLYISSNFLLSGVCGLSPYPDHKTTIWEWDCEESLVTPTLASSVKHTGSVLYQASLACYVTVSGISSMQMLFVIQVETSLHLLCVVLEMECGQFIIWLVEEGEGCILVFATTLCECCCLWGTPLGDGIWLQVLR